MVRIVFMFALLLFSAFSCSKEDEAPVHPLEGFPAHVSKVEAPETATVGSTVPITVFFVVNNSCGEFRKFEIDQRSDATYIKVFPKYRDGVCLMYLPTREVTYEFKPTAPGTYKLKFWSEHPDQYITKTIVVSTIN